MEGISEPPLGTEKDPPAKSQQDQGDLSSATPCNQETCSVHNLNDPGTDYPPEPLVRARPGQHLDFVFEALSGDPGAPTSDF